MGSNSFRTRVPEWREVTAADPDEQIRNSNEPQKLLCERIAVTYLILFGIPPLKQRYYIL